MTYRDDSDLPRPYAWIAPLGTPPSTYQPRASEPRNWRQFSKAGFAASLPSRPASFRRLARRKKLVAWVVSNCHTSSQRENYVRELSKHVKVSIMGNCGAKCKQGGQDVCDNSVTSGFKFYLSFENSMCRDYMTEKVFNRMTQDVVPVVMGLGNFTRHLPPHSYIDVMDYESPKELADYLQHLDANEEEYLSYFWWKDHYAVLNTRLPTICRLCELLHDPNAPVKSYEDMNAWWRKGACLKRDAIPWSRQKTGVDFAKDLLNGITARVVG